MGFLSRESPKVAAPFWTDQSTFPPAETVGASVSISTILDLERVLRVMKDISGNSALIIWLSSLDDDPMTTAGSKEVFSSSTVAIRAVAGLATLEGAKAETPESPAKRIGSAGEIFMVV